MDGKSENITEQQLAKLKELFPEVFSEGRIDWDKFKSTLGNEVDFGERYNLGWKGKSNVVYGDIIETGLPDEPEITNPPEITFDGATYVLKEQSNG